MSSLLRFQILALLTLALISAFLTACQGGDKATLQPMKRVIFVKGDPRGLIEGAALNRTSPLTEDSILAWNDFYFIGVQDFKEREEVLLKSGKRDLERENETVDATQNPALAERMQVQQFDSDRWSLKLQNGFEISVRREPDGSLQFHHMIANGKPTDIDVLHWSVSSDGAYITVLVEPSSKAAGNSLVVFYFTTNTGTEVHDVERTDTKFVYLAGAGNKVIWRRPLEVNLCSRERDLDASVQESIAAWQSALSGRLEVTYKYKSSYPPFTDLNSQCIYLTDSYLAEYDEDVYKPGETKFVRLAGTLFDADIFLYRSEINKSAQHYLKRNATVLETNEILKNTLPHEIGHLLGLGHKFDKTPSIMSYDDSTRTELSAYDIEAIQKLYE